MKAVTPQISAEHAVMKAIDTLISEYDSMSIGEAQLLISQANDNLTSKIKWAKNGQRLVTLTN